MFSFLIILGVLWLFYEIMIYDNISKKFNKPLILNDIDLNKKNFNNQSFNDLIIYLSKIHNIHCGGCGISAYIMYKWLKINELLPENFIFVYCYRNGEEVSKKTNQKILKNQKKNSKGVAPCHIGIMINNKFIDCSSELSKKLYTYTQDIDKDKDWFILNTINNINTWNTDFNRKNIKKIEKKFKLELSEINYEL